MALAHVRIQTHRHLPMPLPYLCAYSGVVDLVDEAYTKRIQGELETAENQNQFEVSHLPHEMKVRECQYKLFDLVLKKSLRMFSVR